MTHLKDITAERLAHDLHEVCSQGVVIGHLVYIAVEWAWGAYDEPGRYVEVEPYWRFDWKDDVGAIVDVIPPTVDLGGTRVWSEAFGRLRAALRGDTDPFLPKGKEALSRIAAWVDTQAELKRAAARVEARRRAPVEYYVAPPVRGRR